MGTLVVVVIRTAAPLTVLRWPLPGALLTVAADTIDIVVFQLVGFPPWDYHALDKVLDTYGLSLQFVVVQRWPSLLRLTGSALFVGRVLGVVLFEATGARWLLLAFPNLFEFFFLFAASWRQFAPSRAMPPHVLAAGLAFLLVPKLTQEFVLHYARLLDDPVAVDIIRDIAREALTGARRLTPFH
jgi:hypothetical protein